MEVSSGVLGIAPTAACLPRVGGRRANHPSALDTGHVSKQTPTDKRERATDPNLKAGIWTCVDAKWGTHWIQRGRFRHKDDHQFYLLPYLFLLEIFVLARTKMSWCSLLTLRYPRYSLGIKVQSCPVLR